MAYEISVNGSLHQLEVDGAMPLLWALREVLDLPGSKYGCGIAQCGACTVHLNGVARRSCLTPVSTVGTAKVTTIEGIGATACGRALQDAWVGLDVAQCGYCQAGQIMSAAALLATTATPSDSEIDSAMGGNLCRCATYPRIRAAIHAAARATDKGV